MERKQRRSDDEGEVIARPYSEAVNLICYLHKLPAALDTCGWEEGTRCVILQCKGLPGEDVQFLVQRCRENNAVYGGTIAVSPYLLRSKGERWELNQDVPFDDDIPF